MPIDLELKKIEEHSVGGMQVFFIGGERNKPLVFIAKDALPLTKEIEWMHLLNYLGFSVATLHYRGLGNSSGEMTINESTLSPVDDIISAVDFAHREMAGRRLAPRHERAVHVLSYSFGGFPAMAALPRLEGAKKLVAYSPPIPSPSKERASLYGFGTKFEKMGGILALYSDEASPFYIRGFDGREARNFFGGENPADLSGLFAAVSDNRLQIDIMHTRSDSWNAFLRTQDFVYSANRWCYHHKRSPIARIIPLENGSDHISGFGYNEIALAMHLLTGNGLHIYKMEIGRFSDRARFLAKNIERGKLTIKVPFYSENIKSLMNNAHGVFSQESANMVLFGIYPSAPKYAS